MNKYVLRTLLYVAIFFTGIKSTSVGPNMHHDEYSTCDEFGKFARFNPYSVLQDEWMSFYYWGPTQTILYVTFLIPTPKQIAYLKYLIDGHVLEPVNWTATLLLMKERNNITHLLVEQGDRGQYILYTPYKNLKPGDTVNAAEIRLKQADRGRYIGFMFCPTGTVYALARHRDIPKKINIQDEAAKLQFKGRGGKSYLYRGHEWMPISEADDEDFWGPDGIRQSNHNYL